MPATAEDIKSLQKGQAELGVKFQLRAEKDLRKELFDLQWRLRQVAKNTDSASVSLAKFLEDQIIELKAQKEL